MERLIAIAMCISAMSMFLSCAALWPHSQEGLDRARNGFLWVMFAFVAVGMATVGYRKIEQRRRGVVNPTQFVSTQNRQDALQFAPNRSDYVPRRNQPQAIATPVPRQAQPAVPQRGRRLLRPQSGVATNPYAASPRLYQASSR